MTQSSDNSTAPAEQIPAGPTATGREGAAPLSGGFDLLTATLWLACSLFLLYSAVQGAGVTYVTELDGTVMPAREFDYLAGTAEYSYSRTLGVWVSAFLTLAIFSFLYRDNAAYKFAESVFVGVSAGYWMVVAFWTVIIPNLLGKIWPAWIQSWAMPGLTPLREQDWWLYLIPLGLGVMLLWRLSPKGAWIARWPLAFVIGSTAGIRLIGFLQADFLSQIRNTIVPAVVIETGVPDWWASVRNMVLIVSVLSALVYFFFSIEHKGVVGKVSQLGVWVLMITFGAAFGYTVMGRIALLAIRFEFLFHDWLHLV
ncbi:MAG: hypothetical protein KDA58_10835 [Planctomycetaceae bacterium]|nr:hypothetical protein [Planctomycetaceae bacterium]